MLTWWRSFTLYLLECQVIVIVGNSGLCCVPCYTCDTGRARRAPSSLVCLVAFIYFVFTWVPGDSYRWQFRSLLCLLSYMRRQSSATSPPPPCLLWRTKIKKKCLSLFFSEREVFDTGLKQWQENMYRDLTSEMIPLKATTCLKAGIQYQWKLWP